MSEHGLGLISNREPGRSGRPYYRYSLHMTTPQDWEKLVAELESQARVVRTSEGAKMLRSEVKEAITE